MAFSVARRAAAVPLLLVNGTYRKTVRSYLDSSILQYQLQRLNNHGSLKGHLLSSNCLLGKQNPFGFGAVILMTTHRKLKTPDLYNIDIFYLYLNPNIASFCLTNCFFQERKKKRLKRFFLFSSDGGGSSYSQNSLVSVACWPAVMSVGGYSSNFPLNAPRSPIYILTRHMLILFYITNHQSLKCSLISKAWRKTLLLPLF